MCHIAPRHILELTLEVILEFTLEVILELTLEVILEYVLGFLGREIDHRRLCNISLQMPSHHVSDHRAIIAKFYSGDEKKMKAYQQRCHHFLIKLPHAPQRELETLFEKLAWT
jgi:hypothetical protein